MLQTRFKLFQMLAGILGIQKPGVYFVKDLLGSNERVIVCYNQFYLCLLLWTIDWGKFFFDWLNPLLKCLQTCVKVYWSEVVVCFKILTLSPNTENIYLHLLNNVFEIIDRLSRNWIVYHNVTKIKSCYRFCSVFLLDSDLFCCAVNHIEEFAISLDVNHGPLSPVAAIIKLLFVMFLNLLYLLAYHLTWTCSLLLIGINIRRAAWLFTIRLEFLFARFKFHNRLR